MLQPRKQWPGSSRIAKPEQLADGWALARWGDGGWGPQIQADKAAGAFSDELAHALIELLGAQHPDPPFEWVTAVPSRRAPELVASLAERVAEKLGLPFLPVVSKVRDTAPQDEMENSAQQAKNVGGAFAITGPIPDTACLLDRRRLGLRLDDDGPGPAAPERGKRAGLRCGAGSSQLNASTPTMARRADASLAAILLTQRLVDCGAEPFRAREYWALCGQVADLGALLGRSVDDLSTELDPELAARLVGRFEAATVVARSSWRSSSSSASRCSPPSTPSTRRDSSTGSVRPRHRSSTSPARSRSSTGRGSASSDPARSRPRARRWRGTRPVAQSSTTGTSSRAPLPASTASPSRRRSKPTVVTARLLAESLLRVTREPELRAAIGEGPALPRHPVPTGRGLHRRQRKGPQQADLRLERDHARRRGRPRAGHHGRRRDRSHRSRP